MNLRPAASWRLLSGRNTRVLSPFQHLSRTTSFLNHEAIKNASVFCQNVNITQKCPYSNNTSDRPSVIHSETEHMFSLNYEGHETAYLKYRYLNHKMVDMFTTQVPSSLGGQGVAKILAEAAFSWAVENDLKMKLSCWYLSGYLKRHPREDVQKLVI